ncbi:reverse transcriptase domain-containing protein [Tanacetum coccineum]
MEDEFKTSVQPQRRVNPNIKEVVKKEVIKLLDAGLIYPISDSPWVSPVQVVPKKGGMTIVKNEKDELIPQRTVTRWRVCIDYRKLNNATRKDHFLLPFIDQMLERLVGHEFYCFLDRFPGYFHIPITPEDQEKTTFTCPYGTFAYRRMPFGLCNAPTTFQRCMTAIFHELIQDSMEIHDKKDAENLAVDHLSRLENPYLGKLTNAKIRELFPEERLMAIYDKNNEPCPSYSNNVLTESYEGAWPKMRQHKFFDNVIADHLEDIMASPPPQEKSSRPGFTGHISSEIQWVEAQVFPTNDARNVVNFLKRLFARFGIPRALISDRGTHFCNYQMEKAMKRYGVVHRFSTAYHPQTNRQVENTNQAIKHILKKTIGNNRKDQSYKLDETLWAFRTAFKPPLGTIPFRIIYGKAFHLLVELEHKAY